MSKSLRLPTSKTVKLHYAKLIYRSLILLGTVLIYILNAVGAIDNERYPVTVFGVQPAVLAVIFVCFMAEMIMRFFPVKEESMGCQKVFSKNYIPFENPHAPKERHLKRRTAFVGTVWILFNVLISVPYYLHWIDRGIMLIISLCFSICDVICILFYCPFQSLMLKNKCCVSCRIYNWDFFMMFTPFAFMIFGGEMHWLERCFTVILFVCSVCLLVRWEVTHARHPEYFSERTNRRLMCANCTEKLCANKVQLRSFLAKNRDRYFLKGNLVVSQTVNRIREKAVAVQAKSRSRSSDAANDD